MDKVHHVGELMNFTPGAGSAAAAEVDAVDFVFAPTRFEFQTPVCVPAVSDFDEGRPTRLELRFPIHRRGAHKIDGCIVEPVRASLETDIRPLSAV